MFQGTAAEDLNIRSPTFSVQNLSVYKLKLSRFVNGPEPLNELSPDLVIPLEKHSCRPENISITFVLLLHRLILKTEHMISCHSENF